MTAEEEGMEEEEEEEEAAVGEAEGREEVGERDQEDLQSH